MLSTFTQTAGYFAPNATNAFNVNAKTPRNYNGSFGIQQDLGKSFLLDLSYAIVLGRDIQQSRNINTVPYGADFSTPIRLPASRSRTFSSSLIRAIPRSPTTTTPTLPTIMHCWQV
jgi:hypothetical protein